MAILQGFPPSNTISPSVRITEKDLSYIAASNSFHRAGLVGFASKGPINLPTIVSSQRQLSTIFGYPHPEESDPYLIYAASQYLLVANELYVVRVADDDAVSSEQATTAYIDIPSAGDLIGVDSALSSFTFTCDAFLRWRLNGISSSKILVIPAGTYDLLGTDNPYDLVNAPLYQIDGVTYKNLTCLLNSQLDYSNPASPGYLDGIWFHGSNIAGYPSSTFEVVSKWASGPTCSFEWVSVNHSALHSLITGDTGMGLGTGMAAAKIVGANTCYLDGCSSHPSGGYFNIPTNMTLLEVVVDGTGNDNIDNAVQVIDLTAVAGNPGKTTADIVKCINDQITLGYTTGDTSSLVPGGFCAVGGGESTGPTLCGTTKVNINTSTFPELTNLQIAGEAVILITLHKGIDARLYVRPSSTANTPLGFNYYNPVSGESVNADTAIGVSPAGTAGDAADATYGIMYGDSGSGDYTFRLTADSAGIEGNNTQVLIKNDILEGVFTIEVYNNGAQVESWGYLTKDSTSRFYVETFLALTSDFLRCIDNTATESLPRAASGSSPYVLSHGSDGIPSDPDIQDELLMGSQLGYTGMYALSEPEQIDIDLIAVPGHASTDVIYELLTLCQSVRMDCLAIIDPPFGLTVKEIVQWQNGLHPLNTTRFDSDFGALYWPWLKMRDTYNRVDVWVPPSGSVMATIARSDNLAEPWYAPAGVTRGIVPGITDVFSRPTLEERDTMYGNRNCINPIVQFAEYQDFMIWGQKTLQRRPTALDRVNVRRLMFVLEKRIKVKSKEMLFDPHDDEFHRRWTNMAKGILDEIKTGRGLYDYIIDAGWDLNTPDVVDRNEFRARIGVQPTRAVEFIFIEFSIHRTGSFSEGTEQPYYGG